MKGFKFAALVLTLAVTVLCLCGCEIGQYLKDLGIQLPEKPSLEQTVPTAPETLPSAPTVEVTVPTVPETLPTVQPTEPSTVPTLPTTEPKPCDHRYDASVTDATCVQPGFTTFTCALCGHSYTDLYTDLGEHSYGAWEQTQTPTCDAAGTESCRCKLCGQEMTRPVDATGHSYGAWETTEKATCTQSGAKQRSCTACGKTQSQSLEPAGHDYDEGVITKIASSCAETGIKTYTCKNCAVTYEAAVMGDHAIKCNTCAYYGTGNADALHESGVMTDMEHEVGCKNCDYGYMDKAYYYLCAGVIDENSAMFTDAIRLKKINFSGVLATWPERWHEFATFTQMGIMYGSWSAKDSWEGQDYEMRVEDIVTQEQAQAVLDDYNTFAVEFAKVYHWKPVEVKMEYREEKQYVRLYYLDKDQYQTYRQQKKNVSDAQKDALANEVIGYTLQKWGIRDGMLIANTLEYLYYMIWTDVAYYDQSLRFHSAYDGFATHTCVCDGYSEMFLLYADALGIEAEEVTGRMMGVGHAWNRVILSDGSKWHVDITNGPILETADEMRENDYTWKGD